MSSVKTAISIDEGLYKEVNRLAHELHVSRSRVFVLAMEEYLKKQESQSLLALLNDAYDDSPSEQEEKVGAAMRKKHKKIIENESW